MINIFAAVVLALSYIGLFWVFPAGFLCSGDDCRDWLFNVGIAHVLGLLLCATVGFVLGILHLIR